MADRRKGLPRFAWRPIDSRLVTRTEAAAILGYSPASMMTVMRRAPAPVAVLQTGRTWSLLWDVDELARFAPAEATVRLSGVISDADGLLTCLECGRHLRSLGRHLNAVHGMTGDQYRQAHNLPAGAALMADGSRQAISQCRRRPSLNLKME